ncbi:MAG: SDR family oxidoreductase [Megasphaera sp.]|jgi:NAD(P)-dependent dehydrogenase (short-subunit alcohol dehydrogenase family)|nr:SDR family oxidoreductase [Megasphaera sp.]
MERVWFITGASRGFGYAFTEEAVNRGDKVIAAMRRVPDDELFKNPSVLPVVMDVTKVNEVERAVTDGIEHFGRIDVLINNAGFGLSGAFEETTDEDLRNLFETDYFGVVNVTRRILPLMRKARKGVILNVSSQGGLMGFAGSSAYCAAKFAVVGLSDVLRVELAEFGITVSAVCPGSFRTDFRSKHSFKNPSEILDVYKESSAHKAAAFLAENTYTQTGDPKKAAQFLFAMVEKNTLPPRILIGAACCHDMKNRYEAELKDIASYEREASATDF